MLIIKKILYDKYKKFNVLNFLYYFLLVFLFFIIATMPLSNETYLKISLNAFIYINVFIFVLSLKFSTKNKDNYSLRLIFIVFLSLIFAVIVFGLYNINAIALILGYMSSYLIIYYSEHISMTRDLIKIITVISIASSIVFIFYFFSPIAYRFIVTNDYGISEVNHNSLTLGYPNPNTAASLIAPISLVLIVLSNIYHNKYFKFLLFSLFLILLYFLFLTDSRSSFISVLVFILFVIFKVKIKISKVLIFSILISVFLFVFLYAFLYYQQIGLDWMIMGKPFFSGREVYLSTTFFEASNSWLIGDLSKFKFQNLLNGMLSVFASGGIINVILYVLFFTHNLSKRYDKNNNYSYMALLAIVFFYFQSYAEGNFMVTGAYFSVLMSMLYVLTNLKVITLKVKMK